MCPRESPREKEMSKEKIEKVADLIQKECTEMHSGMFEGMRWNPTFGQWLVYGFERSIGFCAGAELCAVIERAYKGKRSVRDAAVKFFTELNQEGSTA